jgi:hypothetical protein
MTSFVTLPYGFAMTRLGSLLLAHRHNLDVKCRFLRVATPFQLSLLNFFERVSSVADRGRRRSIA